MSHDTCYTTKAPDIPHVVVDAHYENGKDVLRKYPGAYVSVREEGGATYHVSLPGPNCLPNAVRVSEGRLYRDGFDPSTAPTYKNTQVIDFHNNLMYIYDYDGNVRKITLQAV